MRSCHLELSAVDWSALVNFENKRGLHKLKAKVDFREVAHSRQRMKVKSNAST